MFYMRLCYVIVFEKLMLMYEINNKCVFKEYYDVGLIKNDGFFLFLKVVIFNIDIWLGWYRCL